MHLTQEQFHTGAQANLQTSTGAFNGNYCFYGDFYGWGVPTGNGGPCANP